MVSYRDFMKFVVLLLALLNTSYGGSLRYNRYERYLQFDSVKRFREYVQIDTSKEENINKAVDFWIRQATEVGIPYAVYKPDRKPIFVATLLGRDPSLPSIMLNSHLDVVPVDETEWKYPPFSAYMDENGDIYGRGTQDTKDVGIQYMEAIRKLIRDNVTLERTVHVTVMPDEETGGKDGMKAFINTGEFRDLNIGFALDEGLTSVDNTLKATFVDRRPWQMVFTIHGAGGHALQMPDDTAMEKAQKFINAVMDFREQQKKIMKHKHSNDYTGYSSINMNIIEGGMAVNVIPTEITVTVDVRLGVDIDSAVMQSIVNSWIDVTGNSTEVKYIQHEMESRITPIDDSNPYWVSLRDTLNHLGITVTPTVCPATSDMLILRNHGIPAFGFTPKSNTISRIHAKDEYHNVETFLRGIDIYKEVIKNFANLPARTHRDT